MKGREVCSYPKSNLSIFYAYIIADQNAVLCHPVGDGEVEYVTIEYLNEEGVEEPVQDQPYQTSRVPSIMNDWQPSVTDLNTRSIIFDTKSTVVYDKKSSIMYEKMASVLLNTKSSLIAPEHRPSVIYTGLSNFVDVDKKSVMIKVERVKSTMAEPSDNFIRGQ